MAEALASTSTLSPSQRWTHTPGQPPQYRTGGPQPSAEAAALAWNVLLLLPHLPKAKFMSQAPLRSYVILSPGMPASLSPQPVPTEPASSSCDSN